MNLCGPDCQYPDSRNQAPSMNMNTYPEALPVVWRDLLDALTLLCRGRMDDKVPLHCSHECLFVRSDADSFTTGELGQLKDWGFMPDEPGWFYSNRYGS